MAIPCRIAILLAAAAVASACAVDEPHASPALTLAPFVPAGTFCFDACVATATGLGGTVGVPITVALEVADGNGNPVAGQLVRWVVVGAGGLTNVATSLSDSLGHASVSWTLDTLVRIDSLRASLASGATVLATANARHAAPALSKKLSGDAQDVARGATSAPFVVGVTDRYGNPVSGLAVAWSFAGGAGNARLGAQTTLTDSNGIAQTSLATDSTSAAYRVIATFGVAPPMTFTLTNN